MDQVTNIQNVQFADGTFAISDLLTSTISFRSPAFQLNAFGTDGGWGSQDTYTRGLADVNHDGNADIVGFATSGIYVSLADGTGGFQALDANGRPFWGSQTGGWSSDNAYPRLLADINRDSNADIVGSDIVGFAQSGVWTSISTSTGTSFTASVSSAVTNSSHDVALVSQYMAGSFANVERRGRRHVDREHGPDHAAGLVDATSPVILMILLCMMIG